jgi:streptogramin lyase
MKTPPSILIRGHFPDAQNLFFTAGLSGLGLLFITWLLFLALACAPVARAQLLVSSLGKNQVIEYNAATGSFTRVFASGGSGGVSVPTCLVFGTDGNLYVAGRDSDQVFRYDQTSGALLGGGAFTSGTAAVAPHPILFGADGNLYVGAHWAPRGAENVVRGYNGSSGAFISTLVTDGSGGLTDPRGMVFGPDGNLYVSSASTNKILRYNGTTGAYIDDFATGLNGPHGLTFGPGGDLFVSDYYSNSVLRFDATTGASKGAFVPAATSGGLSGPVGLLFGPDNNLYVSSSGSNAILRYSGLNGAFIDAFVTKDYGGLDTLITPTYMTFVGTSPTTLAFIPEPSTYAALAGLVMLGFVLLKRRCVRRG